MLSESVFIENLANLMAYYVNFNLKLLTKDEYGNNIKSHEYNVWYKAFKNLTDNDFTIICENYMRENVYPPSSPTTLLKQGEKILIDMHKHSIENAWNEITSMIIKNGFYTYYEESKVPRLVIALENHKDKKMFEVYKLMESRFKDMNVNNRDFVRKEFFEIYEQLLIKEITSNFQSGKMLISNQKNKMIGE